MIISILFFSVLNQKAAITIIKSQSLTGTIYISQKGYEQPVQISIQIQGFVPFTKHGFHIHQLGDISDNCNSLGPHYNPTSSSHGDKNQSIRHLGDLGNLQADKDGKYKGKMMDKGISLYGDNTVYGRSFVIHQNQDDLGKGTHEDSHTTGHSGPRIACGIIGVSKYYESSFQDL